MSSSTSTKKRTAQRTRRRRPQSAKKRTPSRARRSTTGTPDWGDLSKGSSGRAAAKRKGAAFLEGISTVRFALVVLALVVLCTAYVAHVHATQDLFAQLQEERAANQRLHLKRERLRGEFDQATGPAVIHERAPALGLEEDVAYGPTIILENE